MNQLNSPESCLFSRVRASFLSWYSVMVILSLGSSCWRRWFSLDADWSCPFSSSIRRWSSPLTPSVCFNLLINSPLLAVICSCTQPGHNDIGLLISYILIIPWLRGGLVIRLLDYKPKGPGSTAEHFSTPWSFSAWVYSAQWKWVAAIVRVLYVWLGLNFCRHRSDWL